MGIWVNALWVQTDPRTTTTTESVGSCFELLVCLKDCVCLSTVQRRGVCPTLYGLNIQPFTGPDPLLEEKAHGLLSPSSIIGGMGPLCFLQQGYLSKDMTSPRDVGATQGAQWATQRREKRDKLETGLLHSVETSTTCAPSSAKPAPA